MSAPLFNTAEGPPKCPLCGEPIRYQDRNRRSGVWCHQGCAPVSLNYLRSAVRELDLGDKEAKDHCLAILACMNAASFHEAAVLSELSEEFIFDAMQPLIDQGIYKDGTWFVDEGVSFEDDQHCSIQLILWTLCSQKLLVRTKEVA